MHFPPPPLNKKGRRGLSPNGEDLIKAKPNPSPPLASPRFSPSVWTGMLEWRRRARSAPCGPRRGSPRSAPLCRKPGQHLPVPGLPSRRSHRGCRVGAGATRPVLGAKRPCRTESAGCGSAVRFPETPAIHGEARNQTDCHHPADKRPELRRQGGSYSRLIIAESKEQAGGDEPHFQRPPLQTTHHCHGVRSCLGPKHRRLIKVYCRFSPIITLSSLGREKPSGLSSARMLHRFSSRCGQRHSFSPKRKPASLPPKENLPTATKTREEASPEPAPDSTAATARSPRARRRATRGNPAGSGPGSREVRAEPPPHRLA